MLKMMSLLTAGLLTVMPLHDFHVSITQIEHSSKSGRLEMAVKVFTDDLEAAIQPIGLPTLHLATPQEHAESPTLIQKYLQQHVILRVDGKAVQMTYLGKEKESDATWCFLESLPMDEPQRLEVTNSLLLSLFEDQVNIVHFKRAGKTSAKMTNASTKTVVFN
jgi:hypothetical protein